MKERRGIAVVLATLIACWSPGDAGAATGTDAGKTIQLHATAGGMPIGKLGVSGAVAINGRRARGPEAVWGGELLEALSPSGASVDLAGLGRVTLLQGARVRLAAGDEGLLVASLLDGGMLVRLEAGSAAYLEAGGRAYTTTRGSSFRVGVRGGEPEITMAQGEAQSQGVTPQASRIYKLRPVGLGASESVKARSRRTVQVQVTDEHDRKVPDVAVLFALTQAKGGLLSIGQASGATATATTNAEGVASVTFEAAHKGATTEITASVPGSETETITVTTINVLAGGLSTVAIVAILAAVGGAAGGGLLIAKSGSDDEGDIRPSGQPVITP
jgi:hypothetical protein